MCGRRRGRFPNPGCGAGQKIARRRRELLVGLGAATEFLVGRVGRLQTHYVPRRSQRTESVPTFFAQDGQTHNPVYAGATCTKPTQPGEVMAFARHWEAVTGKLPELLVFDSKVTKRTSSVIGWPEELHP